MDKQLPASRERKTYPPALLMSGALSVYVLVLAAYGLLVFFNALLIMDGVTAFLTALLLISLFWVFAGVVLDTFLAFYLIEKLRRHDYFAVEKAYTRATRLWASLPARKGGRLGLAYSNLALMRLLQGRFESAEAPLREAISLLQSDRRFRNHYSRAIAINNLAVVLAHCNQLEESERLSKQALAIYQEKTKSTSGAAFPLVNLGSVYLQQGKLEQAQQSLDRAQFLLEYNKKPFLILEDSVKYARMACIVNQVLLRCEQGKYVEAKDLCLEMMSNADVDYLRTGSIETLAKISQHFIQQREPELAERLLEHAYTVGRTQPDHAHTSLLLDTYATLLECTGRDDEVADMRRWIRPVHLPAAV